MGYQYCKKCDSYNQNGCPTCGPRVKTIPIRNLNFEEAPQGTRADKHLAIVKNLNDIYRRKNADYGNSFGDQFAEYGEISAAIRLEDKLKRFKQLIKNPAQVKDESKIDTLLDLANYAIMTVIEMEEQK